MLRLLTIFLLLAAVGYGQNGGKTFRFTSSNNMFPDSLRRVQPRLYNGKTYAGAEHYSDSSVFVFVPAHFQNQKLVEFVFWFHGWNNSIDSALVQFKLAEQFAASGRNAIFIFPEGPKNAPDSYGGKFEQGSLLPFLREVETLLVKERVLSKMPQKPAILLAGHSGAYRVIGKAIGLYDKNLLHMNEILLFDGLYGELDNYLEFLQQPWNRFVHIYTDNGGTKDNSFTLMQKLDSLGVPYLHKEEMDVTEAELRSNRVIFMHSKKGHNEVITSKVGFEMLLRWRPKGGD